MTGFPRVAIIGGTAALLLGASLALSSALPVSGASQIQPTKIRTKCNSANPCQQFTNNGDGPALQANSTGSTYEASTGALQGIGIGVAGVYGNSVFNAGGLFVSGDGSVEGALGAVQTGLSGNLLYAEDSYNQDFFSVDYLGNGYFTNTVDATKYNTHHATRDGEVRAFAAESTRETIEDTGTSRLVNGEGAVRFDSALANVIDMRQGYQVFLTPDGETRGLYIARKSEGGFIVREIEHGRSSIEFDYRLVAHPVGSTNERLPFVNLKTMPFKGPFR
jgi:hypothetical protein